LNFNNFTPIKSPKIDNYEYSNKSVDKISYSPSNYRAKKSKKNNYFDNIQDSIRLKKARSRTSSINSNQNFADNNIIKIKPSTRLVGKSLETKNIYKKIKSFNESQKNKILKNSTFKTAKSINRELNSLDKVDILCYSSRDRTPQKSRSPLKNPILSGNCKY